MSAVGTPRVALRFFGLALMFTASALGVASCGDDDMKFTVRYAPGFVNTGAAMSVLGVFKDGRMSPDTWDDLGPRISPVLHSKDVCELAVSNALRVSNPHLFDTFDDIARAEGITDELLDKLAPSALGDSILVLTIAGRLRVTKDGGSASADEVVGAPVTTTAAQMRGGGAGRGGRNAQQRPPTHSGGSASVFEISASLFSTRQHQSVALVELAYTGASEQEAYAKFTEKLAASFPGATCRGWNAEVKIDEDALRNLAH